MDVGQFLLAEPWVAVAGVEPLALPAPEVPDGAVASRHRSASALASRLRLIANRTPTTAAMAKSFFIPVCLLNASQPSRCYLYRDRRWATTPFASRETNLTDTSVSVLRTRARAMSNLPTVLPEHLQMPRAPAPETYRVQVTNGSTHGADDRDDGWSLPSKNQLNTAGRRIRKRATGELEIDAEQAAHDEVLVERWRSAHSMPLARACAALEAALTGVCSPVSPVVRRLKRWESIVAKLVRERSRLAEMEDTAGCRAILPTRQHVVRVKEHLELAGALQIERVRDYNAKPAIWGLSSASPLVPPRRLQGRGAAEDATSAALGRHRRTVRHCLRYRPQARDRS